jgi:uracil-DNA glycosylase family 4
MDDWKRLKDEITNCRRCPRLVEWREEVARVKRRAYRDESYWGRPLSGFGDRHARLLVVGLAPAAHGANRTGRMFSGDSSGRTLIPALDRAGFANQAVSDRVGDGLELQDAFLTAVCRCAPPKNRPTAAELDNCRPYLARELALMPPVRVILALGRIAFDGCLRMLREQGYALPRPKPAFGHGVLYELDSTLPVLMASYHPSRQNTNTGRLTDEMLDAVFAEARERLRR